SLSAWALGVDREALLAALGELDSAALRAIGLPVSQTQQARPRRHASVSVSTLTTSARAAVNQAIKTTTRKTRSIQAPVQLLLALLDQPRPDPVAELLDHTGIDRSAVRTRLA
ncbi:hypothetical protein ACFQ08_38805, partial [Streptosporangium algeriense]